MGDGEEVPLGYVSSKAWLIAFLADYVPDRWILSKCMGVSSFGGSSKKLCFYPLSIFIFEKGDSLKSAWRLDPYPWLLEALSVLFLNIPARLFEFPFTDSDFLVWFVKIPLNGFFSIFMS